MTIRDCWGDPLDAESSVEWRCAWANRLRLRDEWDNKVAQVDAQRQRSAKAVPSQPRKRKVG